MYPIYKMIINEDIEGMDFMGLVENPAHMKSFIAFDKQNDNPVKHYFNEDEQIIMGVAIATDMPIYRRSQELGDYYVYFDKKETRAIGQKLIANGYFNNVNEQHDENKVVEGIQLDTIFYIDEARGIKAPTAFEDQKLKDGSMIISYKVIGKKNWADIKGKINSGEINGFSIEGWFDQTEIKIQKKVKHNGHNTLAVIREINKWAIKIAEENISVGDMLHVDWQDGKEPMPLQDGEYELEDGSLIQVNSDGIVVMIDGNTGEFKKQIKTMSKREKKGLKSLKELVFGKTKMMEAETVDGVMVFWDGELAAGTELFIKDDEGNELQAPEGSHSIAKEDGILMVVMVDGNGVIVSVEEVKAEEAEEVPDPLAETEMSKKFADLEKMFQESEKLNKSNFEALKKDSEDLKKDNESLKEDNKQKEIQLKKLVEELDNPKRVFTQEEEKPKMSYKDMIYQKKN